MKYLSLFSGIEAATVAWEPLGWEPVAFCEIDEFPSAVLAYHFPNVPNLGDITKVDWSEYNGSDYSEYTVKQSGYSHLPLEKKLEYIKNITGFKEMTVCEDESEAYEYWKNNFNHNPNDCCILRVK